MEYYLATKKTEIIPFVATWMKLEIVLLSEVNKVKEDKYDMLSLICRI